MTEDAGYGTASLICIGIVAIIAILVTVGGNLLVLVAFIVEKSLRTPTNYLIMSLAVTDLLIGSISMSFYTCFILAGRWPMGEVVCDLWLSMDYTACLTSQYTVLFITLDRFLSVQFPAHYRNWRNERVFTGLVIISWVIPAGLFFTLVFGWKHFSSDSAKRAPNDCQAAFLKNYQFTVILTVIYYWTTLVVMILLYAGIYRVAFTLQAKSVQRRQMLSGCRAQFVEQQLTAGGRAQGDAASLRHEAPVSSLVACPPDFSSGGTSARESSSCQRLKISRNQAYRDSRKHRFAQRRRPGASAMIHASSSSMLSESDDTSKRKRIPQSARQEKHGAIQTDCHSTPQFSSRAWFERTKRADTDDEAPAQSSSHSSLEAMVVAKRPPARCCQAEVPSPQLLTKTEALARGAQYIDAQYHHLFDELRDMDSTDEDENEHGFTRRKPAVGSKPVLIGAKSNPPPTPGLLWRPRSSKSRPGPVRQVPESADNSHKACCGLSCPRGHFGLFRKGKLHVRGRTENRAVKALRTISLILGAFVFCWTPFHILILIPKYNVQPLSTLAFWLCYLNSPINPFCYALANAQIKKALLRLLRGDFRRL